MDLADFPRNLLEFEDRFRTEEDCVAYVRAVKWPDGFCCSRCGGRRSYPLRGRRQDQCADCGAQESVTSGTLFHQTHKSLRTWFHAIALFVTSKRGLSAKELSRQLGLHYETAWTWCHKLRATVGRAFGKDPLNGVVEVDETYVGGTDDRAHKGRSLAGKKALVVGAVEVRGKELGRVRLQNVPTAQKEDLTQFVADKVEQHAVACTDGFASYGGLVGAGIGHQKVVVGKDPSQASKLFPAIHRVFSLLKRTLLGTFHGSVSHRHLSRYLDEFVFRFNRRNAGSRWLLFHRIVGAAPGRTPPTMRQLTQPVGAT
jgi:transposase-like protein